MKHIPTDIPPAFRELIYKQLLDNGKSDGELISFGYGEKADTARSDYEETGLATMHLTLPLAFPLENKQIYAKIQRKKEIKNYRLEAKPTIRRYADEPEKPYTPFSDSKKVATYTGSDITTPENMNPEHHHLGHLLKNLKNRGKTITEVSIYENTEEIPKTPLEVTVTIAYETQLKHDRKTHTNTTTRHYTAEHTPTFVEHNNNITAFEEAFLY